MDERIHTAKCILLADLRPITEDAFGASVYVLTTSNGHEWVSVEGQLTLADAADLVRDLIARDRETQFQVSRGEVRDNTARDKLLRDLSDALAARKVFVKPVEPQR